MTSGKEEEIRIKSKAAITLLGLGMVALLTVSGFSSAAGSERLSGAIFTSLEDGSMVNANHYADKRDVYLNAGPGPGAPQTAAGLPDGTYYFQVTDPSGKTLLSSDPQNCSGDCRSLFRAQLMALHMNLLKFSDMGSQTYQYEGDPYNGMTVQEIHDADIALLTDGNYHNFTSFQQTLDRINNNGEGMCVLVMTSPPPIVY